MVAENELQEAKNDAFLLLSYRDRSRQEIETRLKMKGYTDEIIEQVISTLKCLDYLDDSKFARKWIKDRINHKPRGKYLIQKELLNKGVDRTIISTELDKIVTVKVEKKMGKKLAQKWLQRHTDTDNRSIKLKRYLQNRGFSYSIIEDIVNLHDF